MTDEERTLTQAAERLTDRIFLGLRQIRETLDTSRLDLDALRGILRQLARTPVTDETPATPTDGEDNP